MTEIEDQKELAQYDRQIHTYGLEAMKKLTHSSCLISGMNGAGIELAKNIILSGVKTVTIHDTEKATIRDLGTQFFLTKEDEGKNRAVASVGKLAELNEYVQVSALTEPLTEDVIKSFTVVVLINQPEAEIERISEICHRLNIKFIVGDMAGLCTRIFVDVTAHHVVSDLTGEREKLVAIESIVPGKETLVTVVEEEMHDFADGDFIRFSNVEGMTELNAITTPIKVRSVNTKKFYAEVDSTTFSPYTCSGYATEVKVPKEYTHEPYSVQVKKPSIVENGDFLHFSRPQTLHACFLACSAYRQTHAGQLPHPHNEADAAEFAACAKKIHAGIFTGDAAVDFDDDFAVLFGRTCAGAVVAVSASLGGIIGQEVVKAITCKLQPITQWLYLEHTQCLDHNHLPTEADCAPAGSRYDGQIAIFGRAFQARLEGLKYFLVGSGAIGCESLKNFALMGVGCGEGGMVTVTDMDTIEISNLSRQFLFRQANLRKPKSITAAAAIKSINPAIHITALTDPVGTTTEHIFTPAFWSSLDGVANALDNVRTRLYVDSQCVAHRKPLLECGTLGTKCNSQVVVPHLTENYGNSADPPETAIPVCTVSNLPYLIDHTVEFMRGLFVDLFNEQPGDAQAFLADPAKYLDRTRANRVGRMQTMANLTRNLVTDRPASFDDCIAYGRHLFDSTFSHRITQLLTDFPPDAKTDTGALFWTGKNKRPTPTPFDAENQLHVQFVGYAAFLRAHMYSIAADSKLDWEHIKAVAAAVKEDPFVPEVTGAAAQAGKGEGASSSSSAAAAASAAEGETEDIAQIIAKEDAEFEAAVAKVRAQMPKLQGLKIESVEFEKDDDANHHIDFIFAGANLRAINYGIPTDDRNHIKVISGKIIPAIAMTTALISALTTLDLYMVTRRCMEIGEYRNWFINLALNMYTFMEPMPAQKVAKDSPYTIWDEVRLDLTHCKPEEMTVRAIIDRLAAEQKWAVEMLTYRNSMLFVLGVRDKRKKAMYEERMGKNIIAVIKEVTKGKGLPPDSTLFNLIVLRTNPEDPKNTLECPPVVCLITPEQLA